MNEVENEDLVFTLETLVEKFGEEISPFAVGLTTNLVAAFWKCLDAGGDDDDGDEPAGALASLGCLRAIISILVRAAGRRRFLPCGGISCASDVSFTSDPISPPVSPPERTRCRASRSCTRSWRSCSSRSSRE